ncbi:MAG TPA: Rv3654c family TadE-like protein [Pedococcus sp.]|jgi:secretion/DNA translocation related TadE-like protein
MTVLLCGVVAATAVLLVAALALGSTVAAAHRARAAADLGALAAATAVQHGSSPGAACAQGDRVVVQNTAQPRGCAVAADGSVVVWTVCPAALVLPVLGRLEARGRARAGPVDAAEISRGRSGRGP